MTARMLLTFAAAAVLWHSPLSAYSADFTPAASYYNYDKIYSHEFTGVDDHGEFISFEDFSRWQIAPEDRYKVLNWRGSDPLMLTLNDSWSFQKRFPYVIVNQKTGSQVEAKLFVGPPPFGDHALWIVQIDPDDRVIYLQDGSSWVVAPGDSSYLEEAAINDIVIIGNYFPWSRWLYPYTALLVDVFTNRTIHARER